MIKIMFVCHGNICRSPMAEFVMKKMAEEKGISDKVYIASSATSTEEIGNPVYPPARRELEKHGINPSGKYAVQVTRADYDKYDKFICMDSNNIRNIMRIFGKDPENKVSMLLTRDVADPWWTGNFEITYNDIYEGCIKLIIEL